MPHVIRIPGNPVPKPRMTRRDKWSKRPCVVRYWQWRDKARAAMGALPPADSVQHVSVLARFAPPASWTKKRREAALGALHRQKPDLDNILKGVLDALFKDDAAIPHATIKKRWARKAETIVTIFSDLEKENP